MSALTSAFPSNGHSQRSGKQRLQRRAAMIRRHEAAGAAVALDQTAHHHMLSRGLRDTGRLPVGVGGEAEKQEALRDGQGTGDGCGGALARTASWVGLSLQNSGAAVPNWSRFLISVNKLSGH